MIPQVPAPSLRLRVPSLRSVLCSSCPCVSSTYWRTAFFIFARSLARIFLIPASWVTALLARLRARANALSSGFFSTSTAAMVRRMEARKGGLTDILSGAGSDFTAGGIVFLLG